jgi:hypothetical protein
MNGGVLHDLTAIVVDELVTKSGNINRERKDENCGNSPPRQTAGRTGRNLGGIADIDCISR